MRNIVNKFKLYAGAAIIFVGIAASSSSCSKENEETLKAQNGGGVTCDTTGIKYAADVVAILQANCYRCHGNGSANGGVTLDNYAAVVTQVNTGNLIGAITHAPGYTPMPFDGGKLSDCDIAKIKAWINEGTPNN